MVLTPTGDNIVVLLDVIETPNTVSGIILKPTTQQKSDRGTVVATGSGRILSNGKLVPIAVKENDRVLFSKFAGTDIEVDGKIYLMLKENDILAIIN